MNAAVFEDIVQMPVVLRYQEAFQSAIGVPVRLVAPNLPDWRLSLGPSENPFCVLVASLPLGCQACVTAQASAQRGAAKRLGAQQVSCLAGLTEVAVPIIAGGRHVATLLSGQILRREPSERDLAFTIQMLGGGTQAEDWKVRLREAYFATPVFDAARFQSLVQMLKLFSIFLGDTVGSAAVSNSGEEPPAVASAKQFVQERMSEAINLDLVIRHVSVSRFYFCRLFKKATGMTLSQYVTRVRLENAKILLLDETLRVNEVGRATGFRSIPRFNALFKEYVGMAPSEYREAQMAHLVD